MTTKHIAVLGGGISGLSTAFLLLKNLPNVKVDLFEKTNSIGGALSSVNLPYSNNSVLEMGPSSIRNSNQINELMKIIAETNLLHKIIPSVEHPQVYLYYDQKMRVFPRSFGPSTLLRFVLDNKTFISSFFKPKYNNSPKLNKDSKDDCSFKDLITKYTRIGPLEFKELQGHLHEIAGALVNGIYLSEIDELSSQIGLKKIHHASYYGLYLKNEKYKKLEPNVQSMVKDYIHKSTAFSFQQGLKTLPEGILTYLKDRYPNNFNVHWNEEISELSPYSLKVNGKNPFDIVISALPLGNLIKVLSKDQQFQSTKAFEIMKSVQFKSLARVSFYFENDVLPKELQSFGFLNLPKEKEEVLGMTFDSKVFPSNVKETRCSIMIGNEIVEKNGFDEKKLVDISLKYLEMRLNIKEKPKDVKIKIWKKFMPIFGVGHFKKMTDLFDQLTLVNRNFKVTGNYVFSPAVPEIVLLNACLVENILNYH